MPAQLHCSTDSLAGSVPMAITIVANTFSVTFCGSYIEYIDFEVNKNRVLHGQLMFANPRGRIPALVHHTGLVPGATVPGE